MFAYQGTHELAPLTAKEAAVQIGISVRTLRRYTQDGLIHSTLLKRRVYYSQIEIDRFLQEVFNHTKRFQ